MKRILIVTITVVALLAPAASAEAWGWRDREAAPAGMSSWEVRSYESSLSVIAVQGTETQGFARRIINRIIVKVIPPICPLLAGQADPAFEPFILATCDQIVASPDPLGAILAFAPLLCTGDPPLGATVFPKYAGLVDLLCVIIG
jgi:hypothetical protein